MSDAAPGATALAASPGYEPSLLRQLQAATCSATMVKILRREWPYPERRRAMLRDCQAVRVYPEAAGGFVIEYEVHLVDETSARVERLFGELVGERAERRHAELLGKLGKRRRRRLSRTALTDLVSCLPGLGLVLRFAGLDEKLHGLKSALDPLAMRPVLSRHLSFNGSETTACVIDILGHRLGKRCVIRYGLDGRDPKTGRRVIRSCIGKVYRLRDDRGRHVFTAMRGLWERGFEGGAEDGIRIAKPLAYVPEWQLLLMEDALGSPLAGLHGSAMEPGIEAAGRALAKLHRCPLEVSGQHTAEDEVALLARWVAIVSDMHLETHAAFRDAFADVREALAPCSSMRPSLVHRDFYDKQVLIRGRHAILIDFDTLCLGDPAIDVGNFLAHLKLAGLQRGERVGRLEDAFLAGYRLESSRALSTRVEAYTKASLLRLACLYSLWPRWRHLAGPLLGAVADARIAARGPRLPAAGSMAPT